MQSQVKFYFKLMMFPEIIHNLLYLLYFPFSYVSIYKILRGCIKWLFELYYVSSVVAIYF